MDTNIGTIDRAFRVAIGLVLLSLAFIGPKTPFGYIGLVPLLTAGVGFCPLYKVIGLSTCDRKA
jgi:hypothetical protein